MIIMRKKAEASQHMVHTFWPQNGSDNVAKNWSGNFAPDFEGECIQLFPVRRVSICDGFPSILRHFLFDASESMFDGQY